MDARGLDADEQLVGDLAVGLAERHMLEDFALTRGEAELGRCRRCARYRFLVDRRLAG